MADAPKRRGRPPKYTEDNPKPKPDPKNPLEMIRKPQNTYAPSTVVLPDGDNNKYTTFALAVMRLPKVDLYAHDTALPQIDRYYQLCADHDMKPAVTGLSLALGIDRRRLWEINVDHPNALKIPQENKDAIKHAYAGMEFMWENMMQNGKINPVSGIFLGKNNFGYKDQQEYVLTPNQMGETVDPKVIEAKYAELPDD